MITVAGFNTAIDKLVDVDDLRPGAVVRARSVRAAPGGKGLHVAQTIAALGVPVRLVGLIDAAHRGMFETRLRARGVEFHGVEIGGIEIEGDALRTCLAIRDRDGRITELLEPGPAIDAPTRDELIATFRALAADAALAVLSGSLPPGCGDDTYADLVRELQAAGTRCLVDASGEPLRRALAARPFAIKPNRDEAAALLGAKIDGIAAAADAVHALAGRGVALPLLSLGAEGAMTITAGALLRASVPLPRAVNAVGSGDCLLAGVAAALARGDGIEAALRLGVACGAANAASAETGHVRRADVEALLPRVSLTCLRDAAGRSSLRGSTT